MYCKMAWIFSQQFTLPMSWYTSLHCCSLLRELCMDGKQSLYLTPWGTQEKVSFFQGGLGNRIFSCSSSHSRSFHCLGACVWVQGLRCLGSTLMAHGCLCQKFRDSSPLLAGYGSQQPALLSSLTYFYLRFPAWALGKSS